MTPTYVRLVPEDKDDRKRDTMGITKLADLIRSDAPDAVCRKEISDYSGTAPDPDPGLFSVWG